ncbi:MAG: DUF5666 domain-containing protein [Gammaproteobacteria bacterium]|nr:DUF5666 domain-containing protein [Gammaproteobacteria bacterium]MDH5274811.1 DUF5666 domain-containing protein [Gammaproteobacteria bacterium]
MDNTSPPANTRLRQLGLMALLALGVLSTLATGGGGGGDGGGTPGTLQISATTFDAIEGTIVNIRVNRSGGSAGAASVYYATADGTAEEGTDFTAVNGTLNWADGVSGNQTISIAIADDAIAESLESFTVALSNVSGAAFGANTSATVNIVDNDAATLAAFGPITELGSVTINGVRYNTSGTSVHINGNPANVSDLQLGQVIALSGEANFSDATGTADLIFHSAMVIGPVENINSTLKQLIVMGQTVLTSADTVFGPGIDANTYAGLSVGATTQISGFRNANGDIVARRIELDSTSTGVQLIGSVAGLDQPNLLFSIGRLTVDYSSATFIDLPGGMPVDGMRVILRGSLRDGILTVDEISNVSSLVAAPGERLHLSGIVTRFASPAEFDLNGFPVTTDASTVFIDGSVGDLQTDAEIIIDGREVSGTETILASTVSFGQPVSPRTTLPFDFDNFTRLSVLGFARVRVLQDLDFSIEVTASPDIVGDVRVTQDGDTVSLEPPTGNPLQLYTAIVTMPLLEQIDVGANSLANVTLTGFNQSHITVNVGGVSLLRGDALVINDLTANVSGVSVLDFGNISAMSAADIDISGVSQATLNMDVASSLSGSVTTGQGTGVSRLYYYGTGTALNVTTDAQSIVTRLGDTRL